MGEKSENVKDVNGRTLSRADRVERIGTNSGHGYAWSRPDGLRNRCGGEALCVECRADAELVTAGMELIPGISKIEKTPGLIGLDRFVDNVGGYIESLGERDPSLIATGLWDEAEEIWSADLDNSAREGMRLLVRVALAARELRDQAGTYSVGGALSRCLNELDEWERSL